jgi:hypothetical protein
MTTNEHNFATPPTLDLSTVHHHRSGARTEIKTQIRSALEIALSPGGRARLNLFLLRLFSMCAVWCQNAFSHFVSISHFDIASTREGKKSTIMDSFGLLIALYRFGEVFGRETENFLIIFDFWNLLHFRFSRLCISSVGANCISN